MSSRADRDKIPTSTQDMVLIASRRRCCLCFYIRGRQDEQKGQIAHIDRNPSHNELANLVYLCLEHHDEFDSPTSQSKGFTTGEVKHYRERLYRHFGLRPRQTRLPPGVAKPAANQAPPAATNKETSPLPFRRLLEPWRIKLPDQATPLLIAYKAPNRFDGVCRIQYLRLPRRRTVVLCEQIDGNPGMSITNAVEMIAAQLCDQLSIAPRDLVLIQHYDMEMLSDPGWSRVIFKRSSSRTSFERPHWETMSPIDWRSLGLKPPPSGKTARRKRIPFVLERIKPAQ